MDVVIFSASFGGGHQSAAVAIADYLSARYPDDVAAETVDFFERFTPNLNTLAKFAYQQSVQFFPHLYGTFFELTNRYPDSPVARELAQVGFESAREFLAERRPHAVVATYPIAGSVAAEAKERLLAEGADDRPMPYCATVITDWGAHAQWVHPATDDYFVASRDMKEALASQGVAWDAVHATGIPIRQGFSDLPSKQEARAKLGLEDRFTVLVMGGGAGWGIIRELAQATAELGVQVVAIAGHSERVFGQLKEVARRYRRVRALGWTDAVPELMAASDVLLGKAGGITVAEAAAAGLPQVVVSPIPGQEVYNVDFLVNWGAALAARDVEDARAKVDFLAHHPERIQEMAKNASGLGRPDATKNLCDRVVATVRNRLVGGAAL